MKIKVKKIADLINEFIDEKYDTGDAVSYRHEYKAVYEDVKFDERVSLEPLYECALGTIPDELATEVIISKRWGFIDWLFDEHHIRLERVVPIDYGRSVEDNLYMMLALTDEDPLEILSYVLK